VFTPLSYDTGRTAYIIDEFGVALAVVVAIVAIVIWRRRGELPAPGAAT